MTSITDKHVTKICVETSGKYDVIIGTELLESTGGYLASVLPAKRAAIISDTNVWPIYGVIVENSLNANGIDSIHYLFPAGESSKNMETYFHILNFLAENKLTRSDVIIALGGGVVGDIAGFAAATYLRGIPYIQLPTTLLAMVDSSVGGKTAIDLPAGKNLVGAFKPPSLVICDVSTLSTLPRDLFLDGCAEVIKYGILYDASLIRYLLDTGEDFECESVIAKCIALKRDVVQDDEFDKGVRQKLNLGHTIAHGLEFSSSYQISHGRSVAIGMAIIAKAAWKNGLCSEDVYTDICRVLCRFSLPTSTLYSAKDLYQAALSDKKRANENINLIIPKEIGHCNVVPMPISQLESFIEAGL